MTLGRNVWDPLRASKSDEYEHEVFPPRIGPSREHEVIVLFDPDTFRSEDLRIFPDRTVLLRPDVTIKTSMASQAYYRKQQIIGMGNDGPAPSARRDEPQVESSRSGTSRPAETASSIDALNEQFKLETTFQLAYSAEAITQRPAIKDKECAHNNHLLWSKDQKEERTELVALARVSDDALDPVAAVEMAVGIWCVESTTYRDRSTAPSATLSSTSAMTGSTRPNSSSPTLRRRTVSGRRRARR